jgi:hypothetical protein
MMFHETIKPLQKQPSKDEEPGKDDSDHHGRWYAVAGSIMIS